MALQETCCSITSVEREHIEKTNRALLERDVLEGRLRFASGPYEAHVQFSNFCNMSCVMCWDGENPPLKNISDKALAALRTEVAPHLSVITPYGGSEPLAVNWDAARDIAHECSIELSVTTNVQLLTRKKFDELKDITETLFLSIDSHIPEVFAEIRPGSKPDQVFANLQTAVELANEHDIECLGQIVFMTQNAPTLPETVAYLAHVGVPTVSVIQLMDVNGHSSVWDPLLHFPPGEVEGIKRRCVAVAEQKRIRFKWLDDEQYDFRESPIGPTARKAWNDEWDAWIRSYIPGYCRMAYDRLAIDADGEVAPCCYGGGELVLGTLGEQSFEEIWNGPTAQDLRRAMITWDYPSLCKTCRFVDLDPPKHEFAFAGTVAGDYWDLEPTLELVDPAHMTRTEVAPVIRIAVRDEGVPPSDYRLLIALGAEEEHAKVVKLAVVDACDGVVELSLPREAWLDLQPNLGYWWTVFSPGVRCSEARCIVRHRASPRVEGSSLRYPDEGRRPIADLGGGKRSAVATGKTVGPRPELGMPTRILQSKRKLASQRREFFPSPSVLRHKLDRAEYEQIVPVIRSIANGALPPNACTLVISRGDERLTHLGSRHVRHFPCDQEGRYLGFHPADDHAATLLLAEERDRGAAYLILPASEFWWITHYREFSDFLLENSAVVARQDDACVIFALHSQEKNGWASGS